MSKELYLGQISQQGTITNNCLLQLTFLARNLEIFMLYFNSVVSTFLIYYQFL